MIRAYIRWLGAPAGQGVSVLNFDSANLSDEVMGDVAAAIQAAINEWVEPIPSSTTLQVVNELELRSDSTGELQLTGTTAVSAATPGEQASAGFAGGVGARVRWNTDGVRNGRRVIGTTFVLPIAGTHYDNLGTLQPTVVTALQTGANALLTAATAAGAPLAVWSKPTSAGAADGVLHQVTTAFVPDQAAWLTSRRH